MDNARQAKLSKRAAALNWRLEHGPGGFRLVDANGTMVAAAWAASGGYGLSLDEIEAILSSR